MATVSDIEEIVFYKIYSAGNNKVSLYIATETEVFEAISKQENNRFLTTDQKIEYRLIGKANDVLNDKKSIIKDYNSLIVSAKANCLKLDFSNISFSSITTLTVHNFSFFSNNTVPEFQNVEEVIIGKDNAACNINLLLLPKVQSLTILKWHNKIVFMGENHIEHLIVWTYASSIEASFKALIVFKSIKSLELNQPLISTFNGIEEFLMLENLEVNHAKNLKDIGSIAKLHKLNNVMFLSCKKIYDFSNISNCKRLVISQCLRMKSLDFVKGLEGLEELVILNTKIDDSDVSICKEKSLKVCKIN